MTKQRITTGDLVAYAAGDADQDTRRRIEEQASTDAKLAATLRSYQRMVGTMLEDDTADAPQEAINAAKSLFKIEPKRSSMREAIERVVATLLYDSRVAPAAAGYRGVGEVVQLTFAHEDIEVDLECSPEVSDDAGWSVMGQISSDTDDVAGAVVTLFRAETPVEQDSADEVARTVCDAGGVFQVAIRGGTYRLQVVLGSREVTIDPLELG